jgi:small subunit ribosomal protein S2
MNISLRDLLEAGVHFGHQTRRWNPKMRPYIYGAKNGIHIIDLQKTARGLVDATRYISQTVAHGGNVLFVGTKRAARDIVEEEARRSNVLRQQPLARRYDDQLADGQEVHRPLGPAREGP